MVSGQPRWMTSNNEFSASSVAVSFLSSFCFSGEKFSRFSSIDFVQADYVNIVIKVYSWKWFSALGSPGVDDVSDRTMLALG